MSSCVDIDFEPYGNTKIRLPGTRNGPHRFTYKCISKILIFCLIIHRIDNIKIVYFLDFSSHQEP